VTGGVPESEEKRLQAAVADAERAARRAGRAAAQRKRRKVQQEDLQLFCSFCGKSQRQVRKLVAGPGVYICDECIELCVEIMVERGHAFPAVEMREAPMSFQDMGLNPIFNRVDIASRDDHCFYLGPFRAPFDEVYRDHVVPTLGNEGITVERADEIFSTDVLIEDIWAGIVAATFVVADLTTKNANVLYEVGMAHTVGKPVIIITQDIDDVPFDLRHRRCIEYQHTPRGCEELEQQLVGTARFLLNRSDASSSV
jgi:hypothetical protein